MKIEFIRGERQGDVLEFDSPQITVGREDGNDVILLTGGVSRYHARMYQTGENWFICDLNSTNGVKIDDFPITGERILCNGSTVTIGEHKFIVTTEKKANQVKFQVISPAAEKEGTVAPVRDAVPEASDKLMAELKAVSGNLFNRSGRDDSGESHSSPAVSSGIKKNSPRSKLVFNIIFYMAITVIAGCFFWRIVAGKGDKQTVKKDPVPEYFAFYYERTEYDTQTSNAFNFQVVIEKNTLKFRINDIRGQRHLSQTIELAGKHDTEFEIFRQRIANSGVFKKESSRRLQTAVPEETSTRLTVVSGNRLFSELCHRDNVSKEVSECSGAVESLLKTLGYSTVFLTREEVERDAISQLKDAENKFANYSGDLSFLRVAVKSYRNAIAGLEQFTPPHPRLQKARNDLDKAEKVRKRELQMYINKFNMARNRDDVDEMIRLCNSIRLLADVDSRIYKDVSEQLLVIQRKKRESRGKK